MKYCREYYAQGSLIEIGGRDETERTQCMNGRMSRLASITKKLKNGTEEMNEKNDML
jgi:hypothetical protein